MAERLSRAAAPAEPVDVWLPLAFVWMPLAFVYARGLFYDVVLLRGFSDALLSVGCAVAGAAL